MPEKKSNRGRPPTAIRIGRGFALRDGDVVNVVTWKDGEARIERGTIEICGSPTSREIAVNCGVNRITIFKPAKPAGKNV